MKHQQLYPQLLLLILATFLFSACDMDTEVNEDDTSDNDTVVVVEKDTLFVQDTSTDNSDTENGGTTPPDEQEQDPVQKNWTAGIVDKEHDGEQAVLNDIRVASHDGFERIVIQFGNNLPSYHIEYIDEPWHQCGSGNQMYFDGDGLLEIRLNNAVAHNDKGMVTVNRDISTNTQNIKEVELGCDYEGVVNILAGVGSPNRYAAFELQNPARLVIDIRR